MTVRLTNVGPLTWFDVVNVGGSGGDVDGLTGGLELRVIADLDRVIAGIGIVCVCRSCRPFLGPGTGAVGGLIDSRPNRIREEIDQPTGESMIHFQFRRAAYLQQASKAQGAKQRTGCFLVFFDFLFFDRSLPIEEIHNFLDVISFHLGRLRTGLFFASELSAHRRRTVFHLSSKRCERSLLLIEFSYDE